MTDGLIISAALLLDYAQVSTEAYQLAGVQTSKLEPFHRWLPAVIYGDIEEAAGVQAVRDARLAELIFAQNRRVRELAALDVAGLFDDQRKPLIVTSYETPDALSAVTARCGLRDETRARCLMTGDLLATVVEDALRDSELACDWWLVYDCTLTPNDARKVLEVLSGRGVLINERGAEEQILDLLSARWS